MAPYQFGGVETGGRNHIAPSSMKHVRRHYCRGGLNRRRPCGSFFLQAQIWWRKCYSWRWKLWVERTRPLAWRSTETKQGSDHHGLSPRPGTFNGYMWSLWCLRRICGFPTWAMSVPWRSGKELCNRPETQTEFFGQAARALKDNGHWRNLWTTMNKASKCILEKTS